MQQPKLWASQSSKEAKGSQKQNQHSGKRQKVEDGPKLPTEDRGASEFRDWLANSSDAAAVESRKAMSHAARDFVAGTWYVQLVEFSFKDEAKRLGAKWNGEHKCWYAPSPQVMRELCHTLVPGKEGEERRMARLLGLDDPTASCVARAATAFCRRAEAMEEADDAARRDALAAEAGRRRELERVAREKEMADLVPEDEPKNLALLQEKHGLTMTDALRRVVNDDHSLGPRIGISVAGRLLLGLRLGCTRVEWIREALARPSDSSDPPAAPRQGRERAKASAKQLRQSRQNAVTEPTRPSKPDATTSVDWTVQSSCTKPLQWTEWKLSKHETVCRKCDDRVWAQFLECACVDRQWKVCSDCGSIWCLQQLHEHASCPSRQSQAPLQI